MLSDNGLVAFPTETFYGIAADPFSEEAVEKLFHIKGRDKNKPVALIVSSLAMLDQLVVEVPQPYHNLIAAFWPGPLTLIFPAKETINSRLTGNTGTLGIRISSHPVATALCELLKRPITATSANISTMPPAINANQVKEIFGEKIDYIYDHGRAPGSLGSTIVSHSGGGLKLIRQGAVPLHALQKIVEIEQR